MGVFGARPGVRRGTAPNGAIFVNGHYPVSPRTRRAVMDLIGLVGRPMTAREVADRLHYALRHMQRVLPAMAVDGDIQRQPGEGFYPALYGSPNMFKADPQEPTKLCPKCRQTRPYSHFQHDRTTSTGRAYQCRWCRSPKADKTRVLIYPDRTAAAS